MKGSKELFYGSHGSHVAVPLAKRPHSQSLNIWDSDLSRVDSWTKVVDSPRLGHLPAKLRNFKPHYFTTPSSVSKWSSQSPAQSDILTAKLYPMTMGMMEWMWLASNHLMDRRQM